MSTVEIIILAAVGCGVVVSWTYFLSLPDTNQTATAPPESNDEQRDVALLRKRHINLMDAEQLSERQIAADAPYQICVFAPDPLELHIEEVYQSTLAWARRHINEVRTPTPEDSGIVEGSPMIVFWCRRSEPAPRAMEIVRRLYADLQGDDRVFQLVTCVRAPDYLFFVDMTLHRYRNHSIRAYVNARNEKGVTNLLVELPPTHATHIESMLAQWLVEADALRIRFHALGAGVEPPHRSHGGHREHSLRLWSIEAKHLELEPSLEVVREMFEPPSREATALKLVVSKE